MKNDDRDLEHVSDQIRLHFAVIEARARMATPGTDPHVLAGVMETVSAAQRAVLEREADVAGLASTTLMRRLGMSDSEAQVMWMLATLALSNEARVLLPRATDETTADPTLSAIKNVVYGTHPSRRALDELARSGRLRAFGIIERSDGGGLDVHESRQTWAIGRRVLSFLHGDRSLDAGIAELGFCSTASSNELAVAGESVRAVERAFETERATVVVSGAVSTGRRTLLRQCAAATGVDLLEIDARKLAKEPAQLGKQLRAIARECRLLARVPLIANLDALEGERLEMVGSELLPLVEGRVLATCGVQRPAMRWDRPTIIFEMGEPTSAQRARLWCEVLGGVSESDGERLGTQYPLAPGLIVRAGEAARARAGSRELVAADVYAGIQAVLDDRLGQYARRVTVSQSWEDLVLPEEQMTAVVELIARVRERRRVYEEWGFAAKVGKGLGVSALFSGPPGTGKTMVAALIARDLGLELYQVDAARVVSKWIGESEKNLAAIFDAAEAGHAIVLFDEADALFGKRTEVRSSNDRYANLETNYLLQRLEGFRGICLLTSNHESSIDPAFLRRLSLHLRFDVPDVEDRVRLWKAMLPEAAPVAADLALDSLARRYAMSGGYIRNAALRAAFLAADEGSPITAAHLERAARVEYEGMGKIAA